MQVAASLLADGMSVTAVAEAMHAASPYSFSRSFKDVMGVAPSQVQHDNL